MKSKRNAVILLLLAVALGVFLFSSCMQNTEIVGKVIDNTGNPVSDATVKLMQGTYPVQTTVTDSNGDYLFTSVKSGMYKVKATKEGYQDALSDYFTVEYGTVHAPQLVLTSTAGLNKYNIYGVVSLADKDEGNWAGITVKLLKGSTEVSHTSTDGDGNYYFNGVYEGDYTLQFSMAGYDTQTRPISLNGDTEVNVELMPSSSELTISQLIINGQTALYEGNIAYAEYCFKLAYAKGPTNVDANFGYSITYGSTEIEMAVSSDAAVTMAAKILKKSPLGKFLKTSETTSSYADNLRSIILDVMGKRKQAIDFVKTYAVTNLTYEFDLLNDDGDVEVSFMLPEITLYSGILDALSGIPQFIIDKFNLNIDIDKIKNAFDTGNGFADLDSNNDGVISPEEFFGSEFLKLREGIDISTLDYKGALNLSESGVEEMIAAFSMTTSSTNEALGQLDPSDKADILAALATLKSALSGPTSIEIPMYTGSATTVEINVPALFDNSNKIDDWKKLLPSLKLIKIVGDSSESTSTGSDGSFNFKNILNKSIKQPYKDFGDHIPEFVVVPDIISRHAYDFSSGASWLFGTGKLFPSFTGQYQLLSIVLPPEIYGILSDQAGPLSDVVLAMGNKNKVDTEINTGKIPELNLADFFKTYKTGYYAFPLKMLVKSDTATDVYLVSIKTLIPLSPPATDDLVGLYATDYAYGGMTEIASDGALLRVLSYRKSIDVDYLINTNQDANADMFLIPLGFSIKINDENYSRTIHGSVKCYSNSTLFSTITTINLYDLDDGEILIESTDTTIDGNYNINNFDIPDGHRCEVEAIHIGDSGITESGSITFVYHKDLEVNDLGLITIYSTDTGLNYLDIDYTVTESNIDRIWPVIQDDSGNKFYRTAKWGDDYVYKLPQGSYSVWIEYIDTSNGSLHKSEDTRNIIFNTTNESTSIHFDIP